MTLLHKAHRRFFVRHPLQLVLAIVGIAVGVAAAVSVDLAVSSARAGFRASMQALLGSTTHHLVGTGRDIDEWLYPRLRQEFPEISMAPVVEGIVDVGGETFRLSGFDVFAAPPGGRGESYSGLLALLSQLLSKPETVLVSGVSARHDGIVPGHWAALNVQGAEKAVHILGTIEGDAPADPALEGLLLADIATAQELLGKIGVLDRIDLILPEHAEAERRLEERLPPNVQLVSAEGRTRNTGQLSSAFETNLQAMSLLGLAVGMFLIYNTMTFAVLQRRELLAGLRLLGVTRMEILREIVGEALLLGLLGGVLGALLGVGAAEILLARVTRTINDVYFVLTVKQLTIAPSVLVRGLLLGLLTSLLGALVPAQEAAGTRPLSARSRSRLEESSRRWAARASLLGAAVLGLSFVMLFGFGPSLVRGIGGLFLLLGGCGLMIPALVGLSAWPLKNLGPCVFRLAVSNVSASLSRTGVAVAALAIAFAVALGVEIMTGSFRMTVEDWLQQLMQSDLYVSAPENGGQGLNADMIERLRKVPGVAAISSTRRTFVESPSGEVELLALQPSDPSRPAYRLEQSDPAVAWSRFFTEEAVLVSEPFANRHHVATGGKLRLATAEGWVDFSIAGVFSDYRSDRGIVLIRRALYVKYWQDDGLTSVGLVLAQGVPSEKVRAEVKQAFGARRGIQIRSNREIRDASLALFDRTFAVTGVLRLLAAAVALMGLAGSLLALHLERLGEFVILRSLGMTPRELTGLVLLQSGYIGLCAGLIALPLGILVAWVLVHVIQLVSFGWSMALTIPYQRLWMTPVLAGTAALVAGLFPAWRAARSTPLSALRDE